MSSPTGSDLETSPPPARLHSRVVALGRAADLLDAAGEDGFVWRSDGCELVGTGAAARVRLGNGRHRLGQAADRVAALLGGAEVADPDGSGHGPLAVGAVPFDEHTPGELVIPALLLRRDPDGAAWAVATASGRPPDPFHPDAARPAATPGGDG